MIVIGTAGHIDHGKTTLVSTLTGIQTDRLKEEQARGISIELGFAYLDLPGGTRCGIVDVPGHERFVRQMIAGASGIDFVILVVAADEGVMQQTREHFDICRLLGIRRGLVVLTKVDLVDDEWLELVEADLEEFIEGSFLEGAPVLRFAATDEATHGPVREAIAKMAAEVDAEGQRASDRPLRLPVDRVFTMKGFGTVITGTICSGRLAPGDSVSLLPSGEKTRVRGVESHNQAVSEAVAGQRAAVNLQGLERENVSRGDVLTHAGDLEPTRMLDVDLHLLKHVPRALASQAKALVHVGTSQVNGTVVLLDREELAPGDTAPAQLRLDEFVVALGGDHVVLRGFDLLPTYGKTLGGGIIRHPVPRKHRRDQADVLDALEALRSGEAQRMAEHALLLAGQEGATPQQVRQVIAASPGAVAEVLEALAAKEQAFRYVLDGQPRFVHRSHFDTLIERAMATLDDYHARFPHRRGIPREELRSQIRADLPSRYFAEIVRVLEARGLSVAEERALRRAGFEPSLTAALKALREQLFRRFDEAGLEPPSVSDALEEAAADRTDALEMLDHLVSEGRLVRVQDTLLFGARHIQALEQQVVAFLRQHGEMTTPQLKDLTGASRKYTVPLGEHLDARRVTIRVGDARKLREGTDNATN